MFFLVFCFVQLVNYYNVLQVTDSDIKQVGSQLQLSLLVIVPVTISFLVHPLVALATGSAPEKKRPWMDLGQN